MPKLSDEREQKLAQWVAAQISSNLSRVLLTPIASDAGFRRYFRFESPSLSPTKWLAVDAPPQTEDSQQFVALARYFNQHGVSTPKIFAVDEAQGFLLVEDFGDELLHTKLDADTVDSLYTISFKTLLDLQHCPDNTALIPRYDQALLHRELLIFSEWFAENLLGYSLDAYDNAMLAQIFSALEESALSQPQTLVHRDFHSRNLISRPHEGLGMIDFQGALWGACTYDLASLLRDCYVRWPAQQVKAWALTYRQQAMVAGLLTDVSETEFLRWFDWIGLQRHIKVLGIFARLHLRDGKHHYLCDLPLVIRYTLEVAEHYPQFNAFASWFKTNLLPLAEQQPWYSDYQFAGENKRAGENL